MNEYDDLIKADKQSEFRSSVYVAAQQKPDEEAVYQKMADRWGLPVDTVRAKRPELEMQEKIESFDYEKAIKDNPKLSEFFANPKNAAVAQDDFNNLSGLEKLMAHGKDYAGALGQGVIGQGIGSTLSGVSSLIDVGARAIDRPLRSMFGDRVANAFWYEPARIGGVATDPFQALQDAGKGFKQIGEAMAPPKERQTLGTDVAQGIGQLGSQIALYLLTGGTATTAALYAQGADIMADKTAKDKADPALRDTAILAGGAVTALTEKYGLDKILNRMPPQVKNRTLRFIADKLAAGGIEAAQEFTEGLLHDVTRRVLTNEDAKILEGVDREMTAAGLSAAIVRSALGVRGLRSAQQTEDFFTALGDSSKASTLRERLPERFQALVERYTQDGPVQNVFVPAEKFVEYFQSVGMDPQQIAAEAGAKNLDEALATGGDIVIPMADFATTIAPTDHLQGLMQDLRLRQDEPTIRETRLEEANRDESDRRLQDEIARINQAATEDGNIDTAIQQIIGDVEGQLLARYDANTARNLATVMRGIAVLAQRANPDMNPVEAAQQLWAQYGLDIRANPLPKILSEGRDFDATIDPLLDRLRTGQGIPAQTEMFGESLLPFIKRIGGIRPGYGELKDADFGTKRKDDMVVREGGRALDEIGALAAEAGYFQPDETGTVDESTLLNAIAAELSGAPTYSIQNENAEAIGLAGALEELDKFLADLGVDLKAMDNTAVKAMMRSTGGQEFDQAVSQTNTPAGSVAVEVGEYQLNQGDQSGKRGSIEIGADRKMRINLFEKANLSTFVHEAGHFYLEVLGDLAQAETSSAEVKDDYAKILKFLGVDSRSQITTAHHEKFARANEAYLMEGKAPAPELRGVFQRIRAWMKLIYRQLKNLDVELSNEVRGVFDRIYATDAEIEQASREANIPHLLTTAAEAGMTEAEFEAYRATIEDTTVEAKEDLQTKLMRIEKLKREAWWKEERARVAEEVGADYDALPAAQAMERLVAKDSDVKLNRDQLIARYGEGITKRIARGYGEGSGAVYAEDGIDIDTAAEMLGFNSADDMVEALANLPNRKRFIAAESDRIMGERHGDLLNDIAIADEAMLALHNDKREQVLRIELRALQKRMRDVAPVIKAERDRQKAERRAAVDVARTPAPAQLRQMAAGMIGQKEVRDLNPYSYLVAERKAANKAFEAMAKGDLETAFTEKQRELLNHYLYREALKAKQETDKIVSYLKGFESNKKRGELGKAGADYLDQIDGLLERYELKKVSNIALVKRESLAAWLQQQEAEGNAVSIPLELANATKMVNWRTVPVDELRALRDAVKNIDHLARLKNKLLRKGEAIDFAKVVDELLASADASGLKSTGELTLPSRKEASLAERGAAAWRKFDASHLKVEQIVEWLDGGKIDGPWARYFFDLAAEAQTQEYDLHKLVTTKIQELSASMPKAWRDSLDERTTVRLPGFANPVTRYTLISIALNMGNEQNMQRLRDGYGWSQDDFNAIRQALSTDDMTFVQGTWDAIELLWPYMAELEKRMSGLEPVKVVAMPFEHKGVEYRGGYFPLVYDPKKSGAGEKQASETESVQSFVAQGYGRANTNRGATMQRVENLKAPVLLDYEQVLSGHLVKVIKDISHREAVLGINKILTNPAIKESLIDKLGEARYTEMRQWLQVLVNDRTDTLTGGKWQARLLMATRTNLAIVSMGWKVSTMLAQFAGFGPSMDTVKPMYLGKATIESTRKPVETWSFVQSKSGEMRNRANTLERDVKDALNRMRGDGGMAADVRRTAFYLTAMADRIVSVPTWLGGYNQALAEGKTDEDAIRAGDRAVRLSQGGGGAKDLAAVQRNGELMKMITMFYTPFNVLYARLRDVGNKTAIEGIGYLPAAVARLIGLVILPAVMGELLAGRGPDEDEDEVWWAIRKMLLYPLATVPLVRDLSGYLEAGMINAAGEGKMDYAPSFRLSPIVGSIEKLIKLPGKVLDAATGDKPADTVAWDAFEASGLIFGLPTGQVRITGEYLEDLMTGDAEPENAMDLLRDSLFKRPRN